MSPSYDLIVIGAGPGGHAVAESTAHLGAKVAIIESTHWGGACTNWGCIPTKALLACSKAYSQLGKLKRMGIKTEASFDYAGFKKHQAQVVRVSRLGVQKSLQSAGVEMIEGHGKILAPDQVEVSKPDSSKEILEAKHIVLAWGSEPFVLPGIKIKNRVLTSDGILALEELPTSLVIVGGGVIGCEFATFFAELGTQVTIVELFDQILPYEEIETAEFVQKELEKLGITIHVGTKMETVNQTASQVLLTATKQANKLEIPADYALMCIGRRPKLHKEELDQLGINYSPKGIEVDQNQQTNLPGIYAIGDVTGGILLAHRASHQGKCLANQLFGDKALTYTDQALPSCVYTHPNVARVGQTEKQLKESGQDYEVIKNEYGANAIARAEILGNGYVKMLFVADKLAGATIIGYDASELIASLALAVSQGLSKQDLQNWIIAHPSLSEIMVI
ncbi:MAG TPA: dihydrolipoyl dehydrogenase [Candidatus Wirthbacteria bacterium]|nr:dihydrolipoyl dehydrogenase [Candidatus Wirthbacteria bacterium]